MTLFVPPSTYRGFPAAELVEDFRLACTSRALDDRMIALQRQSRVFFQVSGAGHEALLLGLARSLRPGSDWFFPYYRDQALLLGLGVWPYSLLLQAVGSAEDPASGGRQMPSHWGDVGRNVVTQSSPTGTQCLPAVGCAEAGRYIRRRGLALPATADEVVYVSLGEGATSEGEFWESLNTAARLRLPVLYVVADNGWAISVPASDQAPAPVSELVSGFRGLTVRTLDGRDHLQARAVGAAAVDLVRRGVGPVLLHARVTRPYSHSAADTQGKYRSAVELADEAEHDPIDLLERELVGAGVLEPDEAVEIRAGARRDVAEAARAALGAARPDPATVTDHVYVRPDVGAQPEEPPGQGEVVAFGEAIRRTLHEAMAADERIRVFGEDVADAPEDLLADVDGKGGVFGTTAGLQRTYGADRCFNTPLAEANIVGRAVGQAVRGLRPAPEVQFFDYVWPAFQQLRSEAATIRWRSNGTFSCPMVLRIPIGGYLTGGGIWHSQCGESIFAHVPGLLIAFPSNAADAVGLLRTALRHAEDPVLFLEHKHLYRQASASSAYPDEGWCLPFGRARVARPGDDLTIVTYGATVDKARRAAAQLEETRGASIEVLDLRTLVPWDQERVGESVARTGRALVVHEDVRTAGFGAEVAVWIGEECADDLEAPVARVAALDTFVAYEPTLEAAVLPQVEDVVAAAEAVLGRSFRGRRAQAQARARQVEVPRAAPHEPPVAGPGDVVVPFNNIRRRTGEHMARSLVTSAHALTSTEADYAGVEAARQEAGLTTLPYVLWAVSRALGEYPALNASVGEDGLHVHPDVHLGVAVDLGHQGLVVPVVRGADRLGVRALGAATRELAARARAKRLTLGDLSGGTFTVTNPGAAGTYMSVPIINQPQVAILSTDGVRKRPVADGDALRIRPIGVLALSFDHRAVDGAYAAAFVGRVRDLLESTEWAAAELSIITCSGPHVGGPASRR